MTSGERKPGSRPLRIREGRDAKEIQKTALDLLIRFHVVLKIAKIHKPNNVMLQEQARLFLDSLEAVFRKDSGVSFLVRQGSLFFNGFRIKFVLANYSIFKFVLEEFRKRDIGGVSFSPGTDIEELSAFFCLLAGGGKNEEASFDRLAAELAGAGIENVNLEKVKKDETFASAEKNTSRIYFLSIFHLKDSFEKDRKDEKLKLNTTRRLMQSIFNHVSDNEAFIYGLTNIKNYDEYTLNHSVNVCMLAIALGRRLGLSRSELVELGMAAFFHDLGKLETPIEILNKPAKLDKSEMEIMERHPAQGAEKLIHLKEFKNLPLRAIHVALEHHIKEDLSGYPHYFRKETTNLFSKIVKVVDYFDAITTKRVYRKKVFTRAEALSLMLEHIGTEFHPVILKTFVNMMGAYPIGTMVHLDTGEFGIVFNTNSDSRFLLRPRVKLITDREGNRLDGEIVDLTEKSPETGKYLRTILRPLDPEKYGVAVSDYFLAQAR